MVEKATERRGGVGWLVTIAASGICISLSLEAHRKYLFPFPSPLYECDVYYTFFCLGLCAYSRSK